MSERLDNLLVELGHFESRAKAKAAIMAGVVYVDGRRIDKAGTSVGPDVHIEVKAPANPFVSRGGLKLEWALDAFDVHPRARTCLDVGASTGGFTDCLLQRGAAKVYAVDVGYGQLAWAIRQDPRVVVYERTNFRHVEPGFFQDVTLAVVDVSFISLLKILPALTPNVEREADVLALVKPQFEAGRRAVGKGNGVIREQSTHSQVLKGTLEGALALGWFAQGLTHSPIKGPSGNIEFFVWWQKEVAQPTRAPVSDDTVDACVAEAHRLLSD